LTALASGAAEGACVGQWHVADCNSKPGIPQEHICKRIGLWLQVYQDVDMQRGLLNNILVLMRGLKTLQLSILQMQVYQGIDTQLGRLDNVVELTREALPSLPFAPPNQAAEALLTLKHALEVTGPRTVQITFTGTDVSLQGGSLSNPQHPLSSHHKPIPNSCSLPSRALTSACRVHFQRCGGSSLYWAEQLHRLQRQAAWLHRRCLP